MSLAGALEIYDAEAVRLAFLDCLGQNQVMAFDLGQVESCDPAGAQLLLSACKSALQAGKTIRFENVPSSILDVWANLGLPADFFLPQN